jgi:ribosomal protein L7/L12
MTDSEVIKRVKVAVTQYRKEAVDAIEEATRRLLEWLNAEEATRAKLELTGGKPSIPLEEKKEPVIESAEVAPGTDSQK